MMIAPKLLYVFVMTMSATLAFLPHQAAASDFELLTPGTGNCPSGTAVTVEECFDAALEVEDGVDVNTDFIVSKWYHYVPCGCSIFLTTNPRYVNQGSVLQFSRRRMYARSFL
jgi:hypothetical protein